MALADSYRTGVFTYDYSPAIGGGGRHVEEVCKRLEDTLVFSGQQNDLDDHVPVFGGMRHGFFKQILLSIWLNLRIRAKVRAHGLQRINVHVGPGGLFLLRRAGVRIIATAHHTYAQQAEHMPGQGWKRLLAPLERRTLRLADRVVCVSEDTRRAVVDLCRVPESRTEVIPNGIDRDRFSPGDEGGELNNREPKSILFLSRLEARKGIAFLFRAIERVIAEDDRVRLYVGGDGSMRKTLEQDVHDSGLDEHVEFLGFVPDEDLPDRYRRANVFVMPSVFEGFGIPVLEAMACGTPVIGTDVDGIRGLISHGTTGLLVPYGDVAALADAILQICRGEFTPPPSHASAIRKAFDWDTVAKRYQEVLDGEGATPQDQPTAFSTRG